MAEEEKCVGVKIVKWSEVPEKVRLAFKIPESGYVEKRFYENSPLRIDYKPIGDSIADSIIRDLRG